MQNTPIDTRSFRLRDRGFRCVCKVVVVEEGKRKEVEVVGGPVGPGGASTSWSRRTVSQLAPISRRPVGPRGRWTSWPGRGLGGKKFWGGKKRWNLGGDSTRFWGDLEGFFSQMDQLTPWDLVEIEQIRRTRPVDPRCVGQLAPHTSRPVGPTNRRPVGPTFLGQLTPTFLDQLAPAGLGRILVTTGRGPVGPHEPSTS